jgi:hypothetical protein
MIMKKIFGLLLAIVVMFGITSCDKTKDDINKLTEFDIDYTTNLEIPSTSFTTVTQAVNIDTPEMPTNSSSVFGSKGTSKDLISEIKMTKFNLSTTGPNLNFLKSISIYIKSPGQADRLIAKKDNIPVGVTSVAADLEDVNIKDYISAEKISFRVSSLFQTGNPGNQNLKIDNTVHVKATLIK